MTKEVWIKERTKIMSEMLDNPDKYGIYPTGKCFNELDNLFDKSQDRGGTESVNKDIVTSGEGSGNNNLQGEMMNRYKWTEAGMDKCDDGVYVRKDKEAGYTDQDVVDRLRVEITRALDRPTTSQDLLVLAQALRVTR